MLHSFFAREEHPYPLQQGQGLVEYALIILFVAIACVAALSAFGQALGPQFQKATNAL